MKTDQRTLGTVVILSFALFSLPAFGDEQGMGNAERMYTSVIDKQIAKYQAKIELKNSRSAKLQQEAVKARGMSAFLKGYKKELIAKMKREDIGTKDYQVSNFLNGQFLEAYGSAWLQYCCAPSDSE